MYDPDAFNADCSIAPLLAIEPVNISASIVVPVYPDKISEDVFVIKERSTDPPPSMS